MRSAKKIYTAKDVELRVIPSKIAVPFIKKNHYSHEAVNKSQLHFGAFLDGKLHGVMSYGPPLDKSKVLHLVENTAWGGFLNLIEWHLMINCRVIVNLAA